LQELGELIPWSAKRACNQLVVYVNNWMSNNSISQEDLLNQGASWSTVKDAVTKLANKKFKDASGFEYSVEMMEKSIDRYKSEVFDFNELSKAYSQLSEIYAFRYDFTNTLLNEKNEEKKKIMERSRWNIVNPEYYKITFFNPPEWLQFLNQKSFIYRGDAMLQPPLMWAKLTGWFPMAVIEKQENTRNTKSATCGEKMVIQCAKVDSLLTNVDAFIGRKVPPQLFEYALKNTANMFWYKQAFEKGKNKENSIAVTFTKNWIYRTEFELPGMMKWSEVLEQPEMMELSPIVTTVAMLQEKNWTYEMMWKKLEMDQTSVQFKELEQNLVGVVLPSVGGGVPKMEEAFLTEDYAQAHEEENDLIEDLKQEIVKQIDIIDKLLPFFDKMKTSDRDALSQAFHHHHGETKERVNDRYGETTEDTYKFQDPVINKFLLSNFKKSTKMLPRSKSFSLSR